jgi:hydrophobic/amphiphilic exporter-1 (mainly G- bacteria), HAE1 family
VSDVGNSIQYAFSGNNNSKYKENGEEYAINLELDNAQSQSIEDVKKLNIYNSRGATVSLSEVADITETTSQSVLERKDRLNSMQVNATSVGRAAGTVMEEIKADLATKKFLLELRFQRLE